MQGIHLVSGHLLYHALQVLEGDEYAAGVYHQFAHLGAWTVLYADAGEVCQSAVLLLWDEHLVEGHDTVEYTYGIRACDAYSLLANGESISLFATDAAIYGKGYGALALLEVLDAKPIAEYLLQVLLLVGQRSRCDDFSQVLGTESVGVVVSDAVGHGYDGIFRGTLLHYGLLLFEESAPVWRLLVCTLGALGHDYLNAAHVHSAESILGQLGWGGGQHGEGLQACAVAKGTAFNSLRTGRNGEILYAVAGKERLAADDAELVGKDELLQLVARMQRVLSDAVAVGLAQVQFLHVPLQVAQLAEIIVPSSASEGTFLFHNLCLCQRAGKGKHGNKQCQVLLHFCLYWLLLMQRYK